MNVRDKPFQLKLTKEEREALGKLADIQGISMSDVVRQAIRSYSTGYSSIFAQKTNIDMQAIEAMR
ncbi:MAG: ribbon-helix-helix protein, CopG family [Bacteroidales bacterium]